jgi:FAD/FMN-containing dehydrogenase
VTATDDNEHKDLMRALRGGGGNFGIVTEWCFKLYDVKHSFGGMVVHMAPSPDVLTTVLENYGKAVEEMPDEAYTLSVIPAGVAPVFVTMNTYIHDSVKDITEYKEIPFLNKISDLGGDAVVQNSLGKKDYITELATMLEPFQVQQFGTANGIMLYSYDKEIRDTIAHFARVDVPKSPNVKGAILQMPIFGEMRRNDGSRSSIRHRNAVMWLIFDQSYQPHATEEEKQDMYDWAARAKARLIELGGEDGPHEFKDMSGRRVTFFTDEQRKFLGMAKKKYDPSNIFNMNRNIVEHMDGGKDFLK